MQRHHTIIGFIIGAALLAATAFAQTGEVRTFVADPTVATTDATYQYLYNSVRQQYVCPSCSFSRDAAGTCPDPWNTGHPAVTLQNMANPPKSRFLALAAQTMAADKSDLQLPNNAGALLYRALMGRPYHPLDTDGNLVRSRLYAAAAGFDDAATGPVFNAGDRVRWLVMPPTPLRRDARATDADYVTYGLPQRRPSAQVDPGAGNGGDNDWTPHQIARFPDTGGNQATNIVAPLAMSDFLEVGVNPYRVDEGDFWWVRYREYADEVAGARVVRSVEISIYSVLHGWQGAVDGGGNPVPLTIQPSTAPPVVSFPFSVIADSGAIKLTFHDGGDGDGGWAESQTGGAFATWVVGFMVRSNCRLIPGWQDMVDPDDPTYKDITGTVRTNAAFDADPIGFPFPGRKQFWMAAAAGAPQVTTATNVVETGAPPAGYVMPPNATGEGIIAVQSGGDDDTGLWTPDPLLDPPPSPPNPPVVVYHRTGLEWQYDAGVNGPGVTNITNTEAADPTIAANQNYSAAYPYVRLAGARFMATRPEAPRTDTQWDKDGDNAGDENAETQALGSAYSKIVLGQLSAPLIQGVYGPGSLTARRTYDVLNRWNGAESTSGCPVCGAVWPPTWNGTNWVSVVPTVCPYHSAAPASITELTVSGAGNASYNTGAPNPPFYTRQAGLINGQPYYQLGATARYIYRATPPKRRWLMSDSTGDTWKQAGYWNNGLIGTYNPKTEVGNPIVAVPPGSSATAIGEVAPRGGGAYAAGQDVYREATAIGLDERVAPAVAARHVMPATAFKSAGRTVAAHRDNAARGTEQVWAEVPKYQPPSVPGVGMASDYANDFGYRGGLVLFRNEPAPTTEEQNVLTPTPLSAGWDTFYRNPDTGSFQPSIGTWPFVCSARGEVQWLNAAGNCPVHGAPTTMLGQPHYYCFLCGTEYASNPGSCPFDGFTFPADAPPALNANQIPLTVAVREEHLVAEEFEPFDIQVSVNRTNGLAQSGGNIAIGRVSPGVRAQQPDTTVQPAAAPAAPTFHRAFPGDVSPLPLLAHRPSDAKATIRNEGNVALSLRVGNVYDFNDAAVLDRGMDHYLRMDVDPLMLSYARKAQSGPLTRDTFMPSVKNPPAGDGDPYEANLLDRPLWDVMAPGTERMSGEDTWLDGVSPNRTSSAGFITAGTYYNRPTAKPVPLGQPAGTYTGKHLQYVDAITNGRFDFAQWTGSGYVNTDSENAQFNPAVDMPLEPYAGTLGGQLRVFETRLPQSDFYAADSDPIVLPSPTPGVMQVIWSTNRASVDPTRGLPPGVSGRDPTALPNTYSPLNLVYINTTGYTGGANDPLYRQYVWPTVGAGGPLADASVMTNDPPGTINSAPWAMYDGGGNRWAFWHRSLRHAGGIESTLRFTGPSNGWIYDTGLPKKGLRGFWQPGGAWLFWHEGNPGRERLMYRWDFDPTPVPLLPTPNEAPLAVTNAAGAGITDLVNARLLDGSTVTIRKTSASPFTYSRDASVFVNSGRVNVFFSGFVTHEGQADICWTRYDLANMGPATVNNNYAKLPFPRETNEEMAPQGLHQLFGSRHLDWLVGRGPQNPAYTPAYDPADGLSPSFILQLAYRDTIGDAQPRPQQSFRITWDVNDRSNYYDRARGIYRVTPILQFLSNTPSTAPFAPPSWFIPSGGGWQLRDPNSPVTAPRPLTMDINPATGTVQFGSPLFNEDAPNDPTAALTNAAGLYFNGQPLEDVVLHIAYTPYIYRVTRDSGEDDQPSAFWDANARLTVFWRRRYPASEAPHFDRPLYMYKAYTTTVQVAQPPVTSWDTVAGNIGPYTTIDSAGILTADPADIGNYLAITYTGANGARVERHQVIGWSREIVAPVDTVIGEGSMVAVPEAFDVPVAEGSATMIPAVRYWLFWSSPRGVYDLRLVENNGTRVAGDLAVHPSSDIYTAVVAPEFGSLVPERMVPTVLPNPT